MEMNRFNSFGLWLRFLCPTCLTEEDRTALSKKGTSKGEEFGSWLRFLCPTCLTEKDRTALSKKGISNREEHGSWLELLCPTCLTENDRTRGRRPLVEAFMSSGNCL